MKIARRQLGLFILLFAVSSLLVHSPPGAFAANGDITNVRSMTCSGCLALEHDLSQGKHNSLVQVDSDTYALAYSGVDDDGFQIVVLPQIAAINAFQAHTATGKLKADITPIAPSGCHCSYIR